LTTAIQRRFYDNEKIVVDKRRARLFEKNHSKKSRATVKFYRFIVIYDKG